MKKIRYLVSRFEKWKVLRPSDTIRTLKIFYFTSVQARPFSLSALRQNKNY